MVQIQASNIYHRTAIETADPLQLIILCYDAAINDLTQAKELHERREMNEADRKIRHAQDIITQFLVGLDYERGGDIARNLNRLYNFILRQLIGIKIAAGIPPSIPIWSGSFPSSGTVGQRSVAARPKLRLKQAFFLETGRLQHRIQ